MKYQLLGQYLRDAADQGTATLRLSFSEIEAIIGTNLPPSSASRQWWANTQGHTHSRVWLEAGWKVTSLESAQRAVCFAKNGSNQSPGLAPTPPPSDSFVHPCAHCDEKAVAARVSLTEDIVFGDYPDQGCDTFTWSLHVCPVCRRPTLVQRARYEVEVDIDRWPIHQDVLYPTEAISVDGLPSKVAGEYLEALRVAKVSANAFSAMVGRVLESICRDKGATGTSLSKRLRRLGDSGILPGSVAEIADTLREVRNAGVHDESGLRESDVSVLKDLTEAVVDYVYRIPFRLAVIRQRYSRDRHEAQSGDHE
ncbi:MAG: DUF4145 domain-containing protein [Bacillota bacterium]|nr:DUF4145 domain-containing protein [Bacillota bacterium]